MITCAASRGATQTLVAPLREALKIWQGDEQGQLIGVGLPQGYEASAFLADLYLEPVDRLLLEYSQQGYQVGRYVDDF